MHSLLFVWFALRLWQFEVWDVVDKAKSLAAAKPRGGAPDFALDARSIDVYDGTDAVIFLMDIRKVCSWCSVCTALLFPCSKRMSVRVVCGVTARHPRVCPS